MLYYTGFTIVFIVLSVNKVQNQELNPENVHDKFITPCITPNSNTGYCIEIQKCSRFMEQLDQKNEETYPFIKASRCGPANEDPLRPRVCCGNDVNFIDREVPVANLEPKQTFLPDRAETTPLPSNVKNPLPDLCGQQRVVINNRIVGGIEATIGEFPWMARLVHRNHNNHTSWGCSGFLIHRKFVLTAAHCLAGKNLQVIGNVIGLFLGTHDSTNRTCVDSNLGTICTDVPRFVETLAPIIHNGYEPIQHVHDIALIPLKEKIAFTDYIKAICLPSVESTTPEFVITGWGKTESEQTSKVKLKVTVPRVDRQTCSRRYRSIGMNILDNQICAGGVNGQDSCSGDSGGPLMGFLVQDQKWYADGVVSYGYGCGQHDWPGVYTNIPKYYFWIIDNIRKNKPDG